MNIFKKIQQLERLDQLIRLKATGSPSQLAQKMEVSERTIYNLIDTLKAFGAPVLYSTSNQCYYYEYPVRFELGLTLEKDKQGHTKGGQFFFKLSEPLQNFCSTSPYLADDYMSTIYHKGDTENPAGLFA